MVKFGYVIFGIIAFLSKFIANDKIKKIDTIKGNVLHHWITQLIYIFYILPFICSPVEFMLVERDFNYFLSGVAFITYLSGWVLSIWAIRTMGKYWTVEIEIRDNHPLVKKGPYRYLRHPHYLFTAIELFCLPLIFNAYYSLTVVMIVFIPILSLRVLFEEKEMIKKFGEEYLNYKKEVWGLFPYPILKKGVRNDGNL